MKLILVTDRLWPWWLKVEQSTEYIFPVSELPVSDNHWYFHKDSVVFTDIGKWVAETPLLCTMEMPPTVAVRHCSPAPEYLFTPEPVKHHSFAVKFISITTHLTLLLSLLYSSPSLEAFEAISSFPSTAVDHWRGQEEGFLAPRLTKTNHYQKWRWVSWALSAHDLKQLTLTMAMNFFFYWQKLTAWAKLLACCMFPDTLHAVSVSKYYNLSRRKSVNCSLSGQDEIEATQGQTW